jgi:hypothetical protein
MIRYCHNLTSVLSAAARLLVAVAVLSFCGGARGEDSPKPLWLVVGSEELVAPIGPLAEHRRKEGFETVVSTKGVAEALAAAARRPDYLLLVGDYQPGQADAVWYLPARTMDYYRWRSTQEEQFASDLAWGDLDGDLMPEIAVGRIPARTAEQVELAVGKILAFERRPADPADLRLVVWAGSPQFGPLIEATATQLLLTTISMEGPAWAHPWIISGNPNHPLCGWPPDQPELFTRQLTQGCLCAVLMGHGRAESFFSMDHQGTSIRYQASGARPGLSKGPPAPPLFLFCCYSGDFSRQAPSLAEELFFLPGGPVATIAATAESHPLMNYFSGTNLLGELEARRERLGELWLATQQRAIQQRDVLAELILRQVEGTLDGELDLARLRRDHMLMYALLGDPATHLKTSRPLQTDLERTQDGWRWTAQRPQGAGTLVVSHRPARPPRFQRTESPSDAEQCRAAFEAANAALGFTPLPSPPDEGPWQGTITKPGWLRLATVAQGQLYVAVLEID